MLILIPICLLFAVATSLRLNCGGDQLGGIVGDALKPSSTVGRFTGMNNDPVSIYTTHAFAENGELIYTILAPGMKDGYDVTLFFMENHEGNFTAGARVFDVLINGKIEEGQLDVFKKAGPYQSYEVKKGGIFSSGGKIIIKLRGNTKLMIPMISGIDVFLKDSRDDGHAIQEGFTSGPDSDFDNDKPEKIPKAQTQLTDTPAEQPTSDVRIRWKKLKDDYPLRVFEASGTVMGAEGDESLVVFGGFKDFPGVTTMSYQRKFTDGSAPWTPRGFYPRAADDLPGVTHMAQCVDPGNPNLIYLLGGYAGFHPGVSMNSGYEYNRLTNSYTNLPDLPGDRSGGGCVVVRKDGKRMLVYAGGVDRVVRGYFMHVDHSDTWTLDLHLPKQQRQWTSVAKLKNPRNHMAGIEACGRYFFVGGQHQINEKTGNQHTVSEFFPDTGEWSDTTIADMPFGLGHISASTMAWKCGIIVVGGIVNGARLSDDVLHWNPTTNKWKVISKYPHKVATPVCGIVRDQIMCATGGDNEFMRNYVYLGIIET